MKIVITHTDFRIYWPSRIKAFQDLLNNSGDELFVIEISGEGSPYSFSTTLNRTIKNWRILFPKDKPEELAPSLMSRILYQELDKINPDVVLAGAIAYPSGVTAVNWAKRNKKGVVIFDDTKKEVVKRNFFVNFIKKRIHRNIDAFLCPSDKWDDTIFYWGLKKEQIFYGINVVDIDYWKQIPTGKDIKYKSFFLTIGRQIPKKNHIVLLKAYESYRKLNTSNPKKLILIGDGQEHQNLQNYVLNNKIEGVVFIPFLSQSELIPYYHNALLFLLISSNQETWGLVVNEAMACGLPVIVSDQCGCATTLVNESENGFIVETNNVEDLVKKLILFDQFPQEQINQMKLKSKEIISNWGVNRFAKSAYEASIYANKNKKEASLIDRYILKFWKGRYRPV